MKRFANCSLCGFFVLFLFLSVLQVQETRAAWEYLDVPQGFGTLNLAVAGDTTAAGKRNPNRVYRLENGGFYLINGNINNAKNGGFILRVQAAKASGPMPILMSGLNATGGTATAERYFDFMKNGSIKGLYFSGLDALARNNPRNMVQAGADSVSVRIDSCFFDYDRQGPIRSNAHEQKIYVTNTIVRNCQRMKTQSTGRCIDLRGSLVDTLVVQNCTFYHATGEMINDQEGALIRNLIFDHNTIYGTDKMDSQIIVKGKITNNIFCNVGWEGQNIHFTHADSADGDTLRDDILPLDSLRTPLFTEADRDIKIDRNSFSFSPKLAAWDAATDTVGLYVLQNSASRKLLGPKITSTNWLSEYPQFTDPPDDALLRDWAIYDIGPGAEAGTPDMWADRHPNDASSEDKIIATFGTSDVIYGLTKDEFKFSYPTTKQEYTYAEKSLPLGDLNWFPAKKAEWLKTGVGAATRETPSGYGLAQNYPNPFNPTTTIEYQITKPADVSLLVYNLTGQEIKILMQKKQMSGTYRVQWDGKDNRGIAVAGGVYIYRLKIGDETLTRKMVMVK